MNLFESGDVVDGAQRVGALVAFDARSAGAPPMKKEAARLAKNGEEQSALRAEGAGAERGAVEERNEKLRAQIPTPDRVPTSPRKRGRAEGADLTKV